MRISSLCSDMKSSFVLSMKYGFSFSYGRGISIYILLYAAQALGRCFLSPRIAFDAKPYTDPGTLSLELTSDVLAAPLSLEEELVNPIPKERSNVYKSPKVYLLDQKGLL